MNQADVAKLVSRLRIRVPPRPRRLPNAEGSKGRLDILRKTVTGLIKHERIELARPRADEARQYAERLISDAIRYGDCHKATMEMASFWLIEGQLVHKLFKVLVPRLNNCTTAYTKIYNAPRIYPGKAADRSVLELRRNPFPFLLPQPQSRKKLLHNYLLDEAKKAKFKDQVKRLAAKDPKDIKPEVKESEVLETKEATT